MSNAAVHQVLWTGGYDSTFRVLELLLIKRRRVKPHYIICDWRKSFDLEIKAIGRIRRAIGQHDRAAEQLLESTVYTNLDDIPRSDVRMEQYAKVLRQRFIGEQYEWLARYADWRGLNSLELSVEGKIGGVSRFVELLGDRLMATPNEDSDSLRLHEPFMDESHRLLEHFVFPLVLRTKSDMATTAREHHFDHLLDLTWFCQNPTRSQHPCGRCYPCTDAVRKGFAYRIPIKSRLMSAVIRFVKPLDHPDQAVNAHEKT